MQVDKRVSCTRSARAQISSTGFTSTRRNTIPVLTGAGRNPSVTFSPLCKPTPVTLTEFFKVRCLTIAILFAENIDYFNTILLERSREWEVGMLCASLLDLIPWFTWHLIPSFSGKETSIVSLRSLLAIRSPSAPLFEEEGYAILLALI